MRVLVVLSSDDETVVSESVGCSVSDNETVVSESVGCFVFRRRDSRE